MVKPKFDTNTIIGLLMVFGIIGLVFYWRVGMVEVPGEYQVKKGNYRLEDGLYDEALTEFSKALEQSPDYAQAHLGLAVTYIQLDRQEEALAELEKTIVLAPELAAAYANLGILQDRAGKYEEALSSYKQSLTLDAEAVEGPGWLWRFLKNVDEKPSTIADRAYYLQEELKKPPEERLLRVPEKDSEQQMYKVKR